MRKLARASRPPKIERKSRTASSSPSSLVTLSRIIRLAAGVLEGDREAAIFMSSALPVLTGESILPPDFAEVVALVTAFLPAILALEELVGAMLVKNNDKLRKLRGRSNPTNSELANSQIPKSPRSVLQLAW